MKDVRLSKIVIDHFRGYRESKIFDFSKGSDFTVLSGSNGFGKTSFFDAVEWGFTGKLFRFEEPNEEKSKNHFINFQPYELPAKVTIELIDNDKKYILNREATNFEERNTDYGSNKSKLTLYGPDIEALYDTKAMVKLNDLLIHEDWKDKIEFQNVFSQFHLLTQDKLKFFVQGLKGPDRYNQISALLGTSRFQKYNKQIENIRKEIDDKIKFIDERLNKIIPNITVLNDRVNAQQSANIDGFTNLKEFVNDIISRYNTIMMENIDLEKINLLSDATVNEKTINYVKHIIRKISSTVVKIDLSINRFKNVKNDLEEVNSKKETYFNNRSDIEKIRDTIPVIIEKQNLNYLLDNFESYKEHSNNQNKLKEALNQKSSELNSMSKLTKELELFISNLKNQMRNITEILLSKEDVIGKLYNLKSLFREREQVFTTAFLGKENEYKSTINEVDILFSKLNEVLLKIISDIENNFSKKMELENEQKNLEKQNDSIIKIDKKYRDILKNSRDHILIVNNHIHEGMIDCPVCGTEFKTHVLLDKIDTILAEESEDIRNNINRLSEIKKTIIDLENGIQYNIEILNKSFDRTKEKLNQILMQTTSSLSDHKVSYNNIMNEYNRAIQEFDTNRQLHSNYINVIEKVGLSKDSDELFKEINKKLYLINKKIVDMKIDSENIDDFNQKLTNLEENVKRFENKLLELEIKNIETELSRRINLISDNLANYENTKRDMEISLEKLNKILQSVVNNKDFKEFQRLSSLKRNLDIEKNEQLRVISRLENIIESAEKVIEEMNSTTLKENDHLINNIYKRIYPHPYFTNIKLELGTNNSGNNVLQIKCFKEDQSTCEINPAFTFSTAQMNVVAISIFFALALRQKCTRLSTILLDDPVQSMDDINILSFIDILRSITSEEITSTLNKQVLMSTHDEKIFRLLRKKLRFLNTQTFRFLDYNEKGPVFE